jgi:hypothetical protein
MLGFAGQLREWCRIAGAQPRWGRRGHHHPMGSMVFTGMASLAQMELEIKRERIIDSVAKRRAAGKDLD